MTAAVPGARLPPGPPEPCDFDRLDDRLGYMRGLFEDWGDVVRVRSPQRDTDTWVISRPDLVKRILVSNHRNYTKGAGIERVRVLLGNGIMTSEGELWRRQRRMIQPAFQRGALAGFLQIMTDAAQAAAAQWRAHADSGRPLDLSRQVSLSTLDVILRALFGDDLERLRDAAGANPFELVSEDTARDLQFAVKFRALGRLVMELVERRRREDRCPPDLLGLLMQARDRSDGSPMPDRLLVDEVMTLIVAGHETTAAALTWTWYLLARHPQWLRRIRVEAQALDEARGIGLDAIESLAATGQVVREALRLYPPGWLYTRRAVAADRLGDYQVPAGTDLFLCAWLLHRHPRYWDSPDAFRPERFADGGEAARERYAWIPFSAGPRHCVGEGFALAEMSLQVALLARDFDVELPPDEPEPGLEADVNLRPDRDIHLRVRHA